MHTYIQTKTYRGIAKKTTRHTLTTRHTHTHTYIHTHIHTTYIQSYCKENDKKYLEINRKRGVYFPKLEVGALRAEDGTTGTRRGMIATQKIKKGEVCVCMYSCMYVYM